MSVTKQLKTESNEDLYPITNYDSILGGATG